MAKNSAARRGWGEGEVIGEAAEALSSSAAVRVRTARTSRRVAAVGLWVVEGGEADAGRGEQDAGGALGLRGVDVGAARAGWLVVWKSTARIVLVA